jgi:multidrug resistance efflux pump
MLFRRGYIAREEADRAERDLRVARARFQEARARHAFITAAAREEDQARAHAAVALARAQVSEVQAGLDKTFIRAPFAGTVLRKRIKPGEIASPEMPKTVMFTLADTTTLRVRVDVDETDISKLQLGLQAYVTAAT